jgi:hypothetical protein
MGRTGNTGLTGNSKGERGVKTPTGSRKKAKVSPPDSSSISSITSHADSQLDSQLNGTELSMSASGSSRITHGVAGDLFIEEMNSFGARMDWRSFGRLTYGDWLDTRHIALLVGKISSYHAATSAAAAQRVMVYHDDLPLSYAGGKKLHDRVGAVSALLAMLDRLYKEHGSMNCVTALSDTISAGRQFTGKLVREWTVQLIHNGGKFSRVGYKRRSTRSIIHDPVARLDMTTWVTNASRAMPPAKAADFANYVSAAYNCNIKPRTAMIWLSLLGFKYKNATSLEIYNDGHQRPDVLAALSVYTREMLDMQQHCVTHTGTRMQAEVRGARLQDAEQKQVVVSYHDECCCHASDHETRRWSMAGKGGVMKDKSRGACRMVAGFVCAEIGLWRSSIRFINPGKGKDDWWGGNDTQKQTAAHLLEFDLAFPGTTALDVFDNSSGHNCNAEDALDVSKLNLKPGGDGKDVLVIREGTYRGGDGEWVRQSFFFAPGDSLHVSVNAGAKCLQQLGTGNTKISTTCPVQAGTVLSADSELIGVKKGVFQILKERGVAFLDGKCKQQRYRDECNERRKATLEAWKNDRLNNTLLLALLSLPLTAEVGEIARQLECGCAKCTLQKQDDFKGQRSGLEEIYMRHNAIYNTNHSCKFLPKFHPELNPIERVWSRMKWHLRKYSTGKLKDLEVQMNEGLGERVLPVELIRRYIRLVTAYYLAYRDGKDVVAADAWIKKHRSHRGHSQKMDTELEQLYFPLGRDLMEDPVQHAAPFDVLNEVDDIDIDDDSYWSAILDSREEDGSFRL